MNMGCGYQTRQGSAGVLSSPGCRKMGKASAGSTVAILHMHLVSSEGTCRVGTSQNSHNLSM